MKLPSLGALELERGKRALVRVDFNVPLTARPGEASTVDDDLRIATALPTIQALRERGASVVTCGHLGRPKGAPDPKYSMAPVAARFREFLERHMVFEGDWEPPIDYSRTRGLLVTCQLWVPDPAKGEPDLARGQADFELHQPGEGVRGSVGGRRC